MKDAQLLAGILRALPGGVEALRRLKRAVYVIGIRRKRGRSDVDAVEELRAALRGAVTVAARGIGLTVLDGESWKN